jgi:hypothetical protein
MRCGTLPLINLQPGEFIYFSCYTMAGLVMLVSSFLFVLLEFYRLQLQHLCRSGLRTSPGATIRAAHGGSFIGGTKAPDAQAG